MESKEGRKVNDGILPQTGQRFQLIRFLGSTPDDPLKRDGLPYENEMNHTKQEQANPATAIENCSRLFKLTIRLRSEAHYVNWRSSPGEFLNQ